MVSQEFASLLEKLTLAAEAADGVRFASCFTEDAVYHDYIYGPHRGRADIAHMLEHLFRRDAADDYRWKCSIRYSTDTPATRGRCRASSLFVPQFHGKFVVIDGMSHFVIRDGLIACYRESGQRRGGDGAAWCRT